MERIDNIIAKINHLRSLSKSNNVHEACAAAAAADRLLSQYQLSEADLIIKGEAAAEPAQMTNEYLYRSGRIMIWKHDLATVISKTYGCTFFTTTIMTGKGRRGSEKAFQMVGRASDIKIVQYMFAWLSDEIERLTKEEAYGEGYSVSQSYARGVVCGIKEQLEQEHARIQREAARANQSQAMVLLDRRYEQSQTAMYAAKNASGKPLIRKITMRTQVSHDRSAYDMGVERGREIQLKRGLESAPGVKALK